MNVDTFTDQSPTVTVAIPVYNAELYLREAMESVLSQSYEDFEVIAINDGSTDGSLSILREYEASDSRVRIISRDNKGLISTLNEIIDNARGGLIARMDADDICMPDRFERQVKFLKENPQVVCVGSKILLIDDCGRPICPFQEQKDHFAADAANMAGYTSICHPTAMMRREAVIKVGGYRKKYMHAEDIDLWLRLAEIGEIYSMGEILLKYRQHLESIGYKKTEVQLNSIRKAVEDAMVRRDIKISNLHLSSEPPFSVKVFEHHCKWVWWALASGNVKTARVHALKALKLSPFNIDTWKAVYCALRGY